MSDPRIICLIPGAAAGEINGIPFEPHPAGGIVSVGPIDDWNLGNFLAIKGYALLDEGDGKPNVTKQSALTAAVTTKTYDDGTVVTGSGVLPDQSPDEQAAAQADAVDSNRPPAQATDQAEDPAVAAARALLATPAAKSTAKPAVKRASK